MPPLVPMALAVLAGGLLSLVVAVPLVPALVFLFLAVVVSGIWPGRMAPPLVAALVTGLVSGSLRAAPDVSTPRPDVTTAFTARVLTSPLPLGAGCRLEIDRVAFRKGRSWLALSSARQLRLTGDCPPLGSGERIQWLGRGPEPPRGLRAEGVLRAQAAGVVRLGEERGPPSPLRRLRSAALGIVQPWLDPGRAALAAVTLGDRSWLEVADRAALRETGTAHLLAISGLHVGLVAGLLFLVSRRLVGLWPAITARVASQRLAAALALGGTWVFVATAGAAPSAVRAGLMVTAWLLGQLAARRTHPWAAYALAVIGVTLWDAAEWTTAGCQLSFAAVMGLLWAGRARTQERLTATGGDVPSYTRLRELWWATFVATTATLPLTAFHFGQVTAAGLLANLLAVPVMCSVVVPLGLVGLLLSALHPVFGGWVLVLGAGVAEGLLAAMALLAGALGGPLSTALRPGPLEALSAYGLLVALGLRRRFSLALPLALCAALLGLGSHGLARLGPGGGAALEVVFLAVGDGDAILVRLPDGRQGLVDAPGTGDPQGFAERRLVEELRRRGVRRLSFVMATHGHLDHMGGLPAVLEGLSVDVLWLRSFDTHGPEWASLRHAAARRGVPIRPAESRTMAGVRLEVLAPRDPGPRGVDPTLSENDLSLVVRLRHPAGSVLLTGDVERAGEEALLKGTPSLHATLLKVAHHGSRSATSEAFLDAVEPRVAVITARAPVPGRPSPIPALLGRLRSRGTLPLVTGVDGDVSVTLAPWGIAVKTSRGSRRVLPPEVAPFAAPFAAPMGLRPLPAPFGPMGSGAFIPLRRIETPISR